MSAARDGDCSSTAALLALVALGCAGAAPRPALDVYPVAALAEDGCEPAVEQVEHIDQPTALGFSAIDVLTRLAGPRSAPLIWLEPPPSAEYTFAYAPEHGASTVTLDVRAADGSIWHRYRTPSFGAPEGTECDTGVLEIPVQVTLRSAAGALDESFMATLGARVPYRGRLSKAFEPGALSGGLTFPELDSLDRERSFWLSRLDVDVLLWEGGSAGSLRGSLGAAYVEESKQLRPSPLPAIDPGELALWPSAGSCAGSLRHLPSDALVLGFSARDVLDALAAQPPRELRWSDGSVTELSLTYADMAEYICQGVDEELELDLDARARTSDGRIDTHLPVRVTAVAERGRIGELSVRRADEAEAPPTASSVLVDIEMIQRGSADSGTLSVRGLEQPGPGGGVDSSTLIATGHWASRSP